MALAIVQDQSGVTASAGTSVTATFSPAATAGNLLVAVVFTRGDSLVNPTDWLTAVNVDNTTENDELRIAYIIAVGGETTVTFTWTGSDTAAMAIYEISGAVTSSTLDQTASTGRTTSASSLSSGTTPTTTVADEILIAGWGIRGTVTSPSVDNSFVLDHHLGSGGTVATLLAASRIVTATGAYASTSSWTNALTAMGAIATFKAESENTITPAGIASAEAFGAVTLPGAFHAALVGATSVVGAGRA